MIILINSKKIYILFFLLFYFILFEKILFKIETIINNLFVNIDISIIIPIYNKEEHLALCLKSVISQSLKNIEIICIDDGSTDNSLEIIKKYKIIDNRIIIIHQKNQGSAIARNKGISISKGKFIAFMDSDDCYPNNFTLELMFNNAIQNDVLICGGGKINFAQKKNIIKLFNKSKIYFKENRIIYYSNYQYQYFFQRFIYNSNFIKKKKLYFPNYLRYQDPPFFIKIMGLAKKFFALKNITYYYRISNKKLFNNERKIIDIYKGIKECLYISKSMNFYNLYYSELSYLNSQIVLKNAKYFINSKKLRSIITQIIINIDYDFLIKKKFTFIKNKFYNNFK